MHAACTKAVKNSFPAREFGNVIKFQLYFYRKDSSSKKICKFNRTCTREYLILESFTSTFITVATTKLELRPSKNRNFGVA